MDHTFPRLKFLVTTISQEVLCDDGKTKEASELLVQEQKELAQKGGLGDDYITLTTLSLFSTCQHLMLKNEKRFAMQELAQHIKKKILNDKFKLYVKYNLLSKFIKTLAPDLISKEKRFFPFFNESSKEKSQGLWLPIETDLLDLDMTLSNGYVYNTIAPSWFSTSKKSLIPPMETNLLNCQKTSSPWLPSLLQSIMDVELQNIENEKKKKEGTSKKRAFDGKLKTKPSPNSAIRVQVYPDKNQQITLNRMFQGYRNIYNKLVKLTHEISKEEAYRLFNTNDGLTELRAKYIKKATIHAITNENEMYLRDLPYDLLDNAILDMVYNYKSNIAKIKAQQKRGVRHNKFTFSFKKFRDKQCIKVQTRYWATKERG